MLAATVVPWLTARPTGRPQAAEELTAAAVETLEGAPELLVCGALPRRLETLARLDAELTRDARAAARVAGAGRGLVTLLCGLALWAIVATATSADLDPVRLAVVALVPLALFELVATLPAATQALTQVRRSAARVRAVLDAPAPVREPEHPAPLPDAPVLRVRGLRARYGDTWVLDGVDLDLAPGRRVAVIGPSGAGKSTLAAVLLRFLDYEGSVTLGGVELSALDGDEARTAIGLVAQDAHVFDTTVRENLLLARRDATEADLEAAVARARLTAARSHARGRPGRPPPLGRRAPPDRARPRGARPLPAADPRRARRAPRRADRRRDPRRRPAHRPRHAADHAPPHRPGVDGRDHRPGGGPRRRPLRARSEQIGAGDRKHAATRLRFVSQCERFRGSSPSALTKTRARRRAHPLA